ncbi:hypothetical protein FDP41_004665 [Naegleria fowleri]|nr:uncharacterized protein FDP41_004665 [Naegleria fowleri]KAF0976291.1 hypothetical protein FDP41_004665 [Naegleria fowleri]
MTKVLTNADPQCLFKEIRELVSESCSDLKDQTFTTPSHISSIIYPLTLRTYSGKDTFPVFVKLFHKLSNRKFLIRGLNNQLRKRYPQYKAPTYYTNLFQTHESAIDPHTRRQFHCNHFENVIQKISAHPLKMTSQCKAYGISMDISHYTPEHRNRKH